jgi:RNA polymerase sigma-54 factor
MKSFLDHLDLFAKRDFDQLMKVTGADRDDIAGMIEDIRACNPKPGLAFGGEPVVPVIPDVFVRRGSDGGWLVEINSETLPRVLVNQQYYAEVSSLADAKAKAYVSECLNNANWLVKSLDQRARTILKVASEIIRQQDAFLMYGVQHLRPLNLKTVADAISMHESTVSRVTSNKYIATPRGIFELKYFFTSAIAGTEGGASHSAESVRHRIRELIDAERPDAVLSDDNIVEILKGQGIDIARRTVAKYREALSIPSSVQRRREKKAYA